MPSIQAQVVLKVCAFPDEATHMVEEMVAKANENYVISGIQRKDPDKARAWHWFNHMNLGYIKDMRKLGIVFDEDFWTAYDLIEPHLEPFPSWDLKLIGSMSTNLGALVETCPSYDLHQYHANWLHVRSIVDSRELRKELGLDV